MRFFLFRHGQTDWNAQNRFQGHMDVPLNALGLRQARILGKNLKPVGLTHLLSSDLNRAYTTAQIVGRQIGITAIPTDPRLREAHLGLAQGLTQKQIEERFGRPLLERWRSAQPQDQTAHYPEGESGQAVLQRALVALEDFSGQFPTEKHSQLRVGVATHGGVIRRILQAIHPEPHRYHPIPNTVLYEIHLDSEAPRKFRYARRVI